MSVSINTTQNKTSLLGARGDTEHQTTVMKKPPPRVQNTKQRQKNPNPKTIGISLRRDEMAASINSYRLFCRISGVQPTLNGHIAGGNRSDTNSLGGIQFRS